MTTLTQSELDDIRRTQAIRKEHAKQSSMDYAAGVQCLIDCDALLAHIAQLTAERDEVKKEFKAAQGQADSNYKRWCDAQAHASAQFVDFVFENGPCPEGARFVEAENPEGKSIRIGEWIAPKEGEKYWRLRLPMSSSAQFVAGMRVRKDIVRLQKDIQADVSTAHRLRGSGASEWMRDDDRDMRRELDAAFSAARAILAEAALKGEGE